MKSDVSRDAATTLSAIDTVLRRADDLHWTDPAFLEWEAAQVGDVETTKVDLPAVGLALQWEAYPGPGHERHGDRVAGVGVHRAPMVRLVDDHPGDCLLCMPDPVMSVRDSMRMNRYPPRERTTYGPLLLGPEPPVIGGLCRSCMGTGEAMDGGECDGCDGSGRLTEQPTEQPGGAR